MRNAWLLSLARLGIAIAVVASLYAAWSANDTAQRLNRMEMVLGFARLPIDGMRRVIFEQSNDVAKMSAALAAARRDLAAAREQLTAASAALDALETSTKALEAASAR